MQLQTNFRIAATPPTAEPRAVRGRDPREPRRIEAGNNAGDARSRTAGEQAAIVNFGARAVDRAQQREESAAAPEPEAGQSGDGQELASNQQRAVNDLQQRDREVRAQEQTQRSVGGQYAGSVQLDYRIGPDGERYAVSGSTSIDVSPVPNDPEATLHKMETVQRAATAPTNPSGADRQVEAEASHQAQQARAKLAAARYGSAQALAPERGNGAASSPTQPLTSTGPRTSTAPLTSTGPARDEAEPAASGGGPSAPGEPREAIPGRLLAIQG